MGSFGERLRREREKRNIRLEEIAEATKIGTRSLKALEEENFSQLPGGIFNKGFVRAYARFLGIDEEKAVAEYNAIAGAEQSPSPEVIAQQRVMARASKLAAEQASQSRFSFPTGKVVFLLVLVGLVYGGVRLYRGGVLKALRRPSMHAQFAHPEQPVATPAPTPLAAPSPTAEPSPVAEPSPSPTPQAPAPAPELASTAAGSGLVLSIKSSEPCWVSIQTDGKPRMEGTLAPNEQRVFTARDEIRLNIGRPGATELSLNGHPLAIPGDLTRSRRIVVGADGIRNE